MGSEISYHVVEVLKVSGWQVYRVALFGAIIVAAPFSEVAPDAGI